MFSGQSREGSSLGSSDPWLPRPTFELGIAPILVQEIFAQVRKINAQGVGVLVVEQNAAVAMDGGGV